MPISAAGAALSQAGAAVLEERCGELQPGQCLSLSSRPSTAQHVLLCESAAQLWNLGS